MFDPSTLVIGGVTAVALIFGLTEFFKVALKWEGTKVQVLAFVIALVVATAYQLVPLLPEPYNTIINIFVVSLATALTAGGFHKFATRNDT